MATAGETLSSLSTVSNTTAMEHLKHIYIVECPAEEECDEKPTQVQIDKILREKPPGKY